MGDDLRPASSRILVQLRDAQRRETGDLFALGEAFTVSTVEVLQAMVSVSPVSLTVEITWVWGVASDMS